jgi:hypothetical protein
MVVKYKFYNPVHRGGYVRCCFCSPGASSCVFCMVPVYFLIYLSPLCRFTSAVLTPAVRDVSDTRTCIDFMAVQSYCNVKSLLTQKPEDGHIKAIPLQVLTGPEGSRRLRLPDFKTIGT